MCFIRENLERYDRKDIAIKFNVTPAYVSNILNERPGFAARTDIVQEAYNRAIKNIESKANINKMANSIETLTKHSNMEGHEDFKELLEALIQNQERAIKAAVDTVRDEMRQMMGKIDNPRLKRQFIKMEYFDGSDYRTDAFLAKYFKELDVKKAGKTSPVTVDKKKFFEIFKTSAIC